MVPPSKFEGKDIQKIVRKMMGKRGLFRKEPLEDIKCEDMVWMPYHRIQFSYTHSEKGSIRRFGETRRGETVLNAMFCGCVKSEEELFMLFRPNYLKYKVMRHSPQPEEVVGPTFHPDFDGLLGGFLKRLNEVKDELNEVTSELRKSRVRTSRYSRIMPVMWDLKKERTLSEKVAKLSATKYTLSMCLNVNEIISSIKVTDSNIFYYPILIVTLKDKENVTERYLMVNLVKSKSTSDQLSFDSRLTELCAKNSRCKEIITKSLTSQRDCT